MEDMSNKSVWQDIVDVVLDAKGVDPVVLDMSHQCSWGDYMVIVTAGSRMHMKGIYGRITEYLKERDDIAMHNHPETKQEDRWILVDMGSVVVHIMTSEAREYYSLEDVWFESPVLFREQAPAG